MADQRRLVKFGLLCRQGARVDDASCRLSGAVDSAISEALQEATPLSRVAIMKSRQTHLHLSLDARESARQIAVVLSSLE